MNHAILIAMRIAIITGASSGLGKEYVRQLAHKEKQLDQLWIIARRTDRLEEIKKNTPLPVRPLSMDLTEESSMKELEDLLQAEKPQIQLLINAAGFGKVGNYQAVSRLESDRMITLNCKSAVDMTLICLPYMQRGSRIMEVCSTAAFQPFQMLAIYAASKAFLYRYSRALRVELFPRGIKVTAVCPYWIKDTEFIPVAKQTDSKKAIRHFPLAGHSRSVAALSLFDSRIGLPVSTPGPICFLHRIVAKFIPGELMMGLWALIRRI